jgi:3D (Asp-Asp-Asp) domain-containing protein
MLSKKIIISVFILSFLFTGLFLARNEAAMAASNLSEGSRSTEAVQLQETLNTKGYWCGAVDGILGSKSYQAVVRFQIETNLVADGIVGLRTRLAPGLSTIAASTPATTPDSTSVLEPASLPVSTSVTKPISKPVSKPASNVSRGSSAVSQGKRVLTMVATGYDGCYECNKPYYGQPSYIGLPLRRGIVAVDPKVIPMGTRLYVEGYGEALAADQGNAIKSNRIDLFFDTHQQGLDWGIKTVKVTIL